MENIAIKRIYEPAAVTDGYRILVDRLWPRGMKKEDAGIDKWMKAIAPSDALRKWYHQDISEWDVFRHKYLLELKENPAVSEFLSLIKDHETVTLLYAARNEHQNHALVLCEFLQTS
ncbi:DUF488 family protein [Mucilaginibacter sp. BJC16-A38]|uniref:DUF488 domain-containing protein n=1 Tax=Mucilaginibacter phenanthrenivorans TaxID=1234842 RepID=UPI002157E78C|nr:DUF488 family protein [Mucilaginibacter phenanthrenivorans]MCR8556162.1 DUF488 family protein [Mucilaginibacter phenanthrenivorans]